MVNINLEEIKTKLNLLPSINFQSRHITRVDTLVSVTTKRIESLIGQKKTKHVLNLIL